MTPPGQRAVRHRFPADAFRRDRSWVRWFERHTVASLPVEQHRAASVRVLMSWSCAGRSQASRSPNPHRACFAPLRRAVNWLGYFHSLDPARRPGGRLVEWPDRNRPADWTQVKWPAARRSGPLGPVRAQLPDQTHPLKCGGLSRRPPPRHQPPLTEPKQPRARIGAAPLHIHPPHTHPHQRRPFQQLPPHRPHRRPRPLRPGQTPGPHPLHQKKRQGRQPQPQRVAGQVMRREPIGLQVQGLLLEHVFHPAPRTVQFLVEPLRTEAARS